MPHYRLYLLNSDTGRIDRAEELEAADDVSAIAQARLRQDRVPLEIWQEKRKVAHIEPRPRASADT